MNKAYLLIGGNLGDRFANLSVAQKLIQQKLGIISQASSIYETAAWGYAAQPDFLNQAFCIETSYNAFELMSQILLLEKEMGRARDIPMGPRIIDIDIIYFNNEIINEASLIVPHPKITDRRFVLLPIQEIAPDYLHPILLKSNTILLKECGDSLAVYKKAP
jgi:2-amino-4-hydroxy-6-hydroxymethyldihydropteridine diphosphokinase